MSTLTAVAKVVLDDQFDEFSRLHRQFRVDKSDVIARDDVTDYLDEDSNEDDLLWAFGYAHQCVGWIDWSGEDDKDQLKNFVQARLTKLGLSKMDWKFLDTFEKSIDLKAMQRGDYFAKKLSCVDAELRKKDFLIALLDRGDDQYYPFVASSKDFQAISGTQLENTTVVAWAEYN